MASFKDYYSKTAGNTKLSTEGIEPFHFDGKLGLHSYSQVFFYKYKGNALIWNVIATETDEFNDKAHAGRKTMLLDCYSVIEKGAFGQTNTKWRESTLRSFLNATLYRNLDESSQYIVYSCKENMSLDDRQLGSTEFAPLNNDKFFALDHAEIRNPKYGYRKKGEITFDNATLKKYGNKYVPYWLRSKIDQKTCLPMQIALK